MLNQLANYPDNELNSLIAPLFAATRDIAAASHAQAIVEALRRYILGETVDRISIIQIGFGLAGEPVTEEIAVWDRDQIALEADLPPALRRHIAREPLIISNVDALDRSVAAVVDYARGVLKATSLAIFPLMGRSRTVGYLVLAGRRPHAYHEREVEVLRMLGVQVAFALENLSLLGAVSRKTEQLNLVNELARALAEVHDLTTLGELVSATLSRSCSISHLSITFHEADQPKVRVNTFVGDFLPPQLELEGTVIERVLTTGRVVRVDDVRELADGSLWRGVGAHALIVAPLSARDRRIGTLNVGAGTVGGFSENDVELCQRIAAQLGVSLENVQLFEQLQHFLKDMTTLYSASLAMSATHDLGETCEVALGELADLSGADRITLYLTRPNPQDKAQRVETIAVWEHGAIKTSELGESDSTLAAPIIAQFPGSRANLIFNDLEADSRLDSSVRVQLTLQGVNALMMIPVTTGTTWLGAALLEARQGQSFSGEQARLCRNIADQTALIIDSHLLLMRAQEAAERERVLRDLAAALSSTFDPDQILGLLLDHIGRLLPYDAASILIVEDGFAKPAATRGYAGQGADETALHALNIPIQQVVHLKQMADTKQPRVIEDTRSFPDWADTPETHWVRSCVSAPIYIEDEVIGFINLDGAMPRSFTPEHASLLQTFADQAAVAIKNALLYQESRRRAEAAAAVSRLTAQLQRAPSVDGVMQATVRALRETLGEYEVTVRLSPPMLDTTHRLLPESGDAEADPP